MAEFADPEDLFDDLVTCSICLESFKDPRYLPCLHTFCRECLNTYISSSVKEQETEPFECPVCRQKVTFGERLDKGKDVSACLPRNHFVISLMDKLEIQRNEKKCSACEVHGEQENAVSWCTVCQEAYCKSCVKSHRAFKATTKHELVNMAAVSKNEVQIASTVFCDEHPMEPVKIYCVEHTLPCCTVCATVNHRKCEEVITIDKAVAGIKQSTQSANLITKLGDIARSIDGALDNRNKNKERFGNETDAIILKIQAFRAEINGKLDKMETELKTDVLNSKRNNLLKMENELSRLSDMKSSVDNWSKVIDACRKHGSDVMFLSRMNQILEKLPHIETSLLELEHTNFATSIELELADVLSNAHTLGKVVLQADQPTCQVASQRKVNLQSGRVKVINTINIHVVSKNAILYQISGTFCHGNIILTDNRGKRLIKYDKSGKELGVLAFDVSPCDVAAVDINEIQLIVSFSTQDIYLVNADKMTKLWSLRLGVPAYGICESGNEIVSYYEGNISWSDISSGAKKIDVGCTSSTAFIACDSKGGCVHSNAYRTITNISPDRQKRFTYKTKEETWIYGCCVDFEGNIYAAGFNSDKIYQLSSEGNLIRILKISDIDRSAPSRPWSIRFEKETSRFLLTFHDSNVVLICEIN